ncbi:hypothetical protein JTB14_001473 [Gonioctena quinquepunctata]|nr:hypothetical protein JTB14_001473 [Gonioctena quinquepunctata]
MCRDGGTYDVHLQFVEPLLNSHLVQWKEKAHLPARLGVLSEDGVCKPFDEHGYGYVRSEAASAILLQKAKNSKRIYAQLIHSKCNSDGFKEIGITFPSRQDQANVIEEVLIESNIDPEEVTFVEAHATGPCISTKFRSGSKYQKSWECEVVISENKFSHLSKYRSYYEELQPSLVAIERTAAGDPEECAGIDAVIAKKRKTPLSVGSIKGNLGHSEQSAASSSIIKVSMATILSYAF